MPRVVLARKEQPGLREHKVDKANRDHKALKVHREPLDHKGFRDHGEMMAQ